jgi:hypothetical protein
MGIVLIIHAVFVAVAALKYGKNEWLFVKGVLFYVFFSALLLFEFLYAKFYLNKKVEYIPQVYTFEDTQGEYFIEIDSGMIEELEKD